MEAPQTTVEGDAAGNAANAATTEDAGTVVAKVVEQWSEAEVQKRDLALAYILTSIGATCNGTVRKLRCPALVWHTLRDMF